MSSFPDHFSGRAGGYRAHRPTYPGALVDVLAGLAARTGTAWDAGCGSGQLSVRLTRRFRRVLATDASAEQLARAERHPRVEYREARAEESGLPAASTDLVVAAQAAHWFDLDAFWDEVRRVVRPDGAVALVSYGLMRVTPEVDATVRRFYEDVLDPWWPPQRRHVEARYRTLSFPFGEVEGPELEIRHRWTLEDLLGYLSTWSAVQAMEAARGEGATAALEDELTAAWGRPRQARTVAWPLALRLGRL